MTAHARTLSHVDRTFIRTVCPSISEMGWGHYFVPETGARAEELGLDMFSFYFLGRGGVLGDCEAEVVSSAFGYFNPGLVAAMWDKGRSVLAPRQAAREFLGCSHAYGRKHFSDVPELDEFCQAAESVVRAAPVDGLPLFAGVSVEPLPDDPPARAMQLVSVLREFRGSAHLVAVVAAGIPTSVAHYVKRPDMWQIFGWDEGDAPEVTREDRARMDEVEEVTDRLVAPPYLTLDGAGRDALITGLERMQAALALGGR